eukprot:7421027-Ditylum_brightwellii.AAC.1
MERKKMFILIGMKRETVSLMHQGISLQDEMSDLNLGFKDCLFYKSGDISQEVYNLVLYSILKFDQQQQAAFFEAVMNGDGDTVSAYHGQYFSYTLDALKEH